MVCVVGAIGFLTPAFATEQVYHPVSPALGGNPTNGTFLLSTAQAQGEGVNSGNQGPNLTPLTNAIAGGVTNGLNSNGGSGSGGGSTSGSNGVTQGITGRTLANPLGTNSGMP